MPDQLKINEELGIIEVYSSGEITREEAEAKKEADKAYKEALIEVDQED